MSSLTYLLLALVVATSGSTGNGSGGSSTTTSKRRRRRLWRRRMSSSTECFCGSMNNSYNDRSVGHMVTAGCCASNGGNTGKKGVLDSSTGTTTIGR